MKEHEMPNIAPDNTLQTVITTFEVNPGTCQDLLEELAEAYADFVSGQPGFVAATFHVNDAQTRIANYSQWEKREDFMAMLRTAQMRERSRRINNLCRSFEPVMYDIVHTFSAP